MTQKPKRHCEQSGAIQDHHQKTGSPRPYGPRDDERPTIEDIDAILPQTQCGQCGYNGCLPYAEALVNKGEKINRCPPGGVKGLLLLGKLLNQDPTPYIEELRAQEQPPRVAIIDENACIGCMKCIQACPVDAIVGTSKRMHTVIEDECTGCGLCVAPCPVDCIDMVALVEKNEPLDCHVANNAPRNDKADQHRRRFIARNERLREKELKKEKKLIATKINDGSIKNRKSEIAAAIARAKKKSS